MRKNDKLLIFFFSLSEIWIWMNGDDNLILILDGNSENDAHAWRKKSLFVENKFKFASRSGDLNGLSYRFHDTMCALISELPSKLSSLNVTMNRKKWQILITTSNSIFYQTFFLIFLFLAVGLRKSVFLKGKKIIYIILIYI